MRTILFTNPLYTIDSSSVTIQVGNNNTFLRVIEHHGTGRAEGQKSSGPGAPAQGSPHPVRAAKTRERSPALVPPCCCLVSGRNLGTHLHPRSRTARPPRLPLADIDFSMKNILLILRSITVDTHIDD